MAQRDKEEPMELHAPEITVCANNCGFPGNPATNNLCQNCFLAASAAASTSSPASPPSFPGPSPAPAVDKQRPALEMAAPCPAVDRSTAGTAVEVKAAKSANRCFRCRKRVGLTGFRCRCGDLFCGEHRYSDRHACSYDYKASARDAIARENPVVRASKIVRF